MPAAAPARPAVLLLAGDVREAWSEALAAGGFEVRTTGWLDGVTAARLRRPDLVLVSADLPAGAPQMVCMTFRCAGDLKDIPVAIAGLDPDVAAGEGELPTRADRYVPAPIDVAALVREVREALRIGRVPWKRTPAQSAVLWLVGLAMVALFGRFVADEVLSWSRGGTGLDPTADAVLVGLGFAATVAALVVGMVARGARRSTLLWVGFSFWQCMNFVGAGHVLKPAGFSLALTSWAIWAWLGPRVKPRTRGARRGWHLLAALFLLLAAAPWIAMLVLRAAE